MKDAITCQGRVITIDELLWLRNLIHERKDWSRYRLACQLVINGTGVLPQGK